MAKVNRGVKYSLFAVTLVLLSAVIVPAMAQYGDGGYGGGYEDGRGYSRESKMEYGDPFGGGPGLQGGNFGEMDRGSQTMRTMRPDMMRGRGGDTMNSGHGMKMPQPPMRGGMGGGNPFNRFRVDANNLQGSIDMIQNIFMFLSFFYIELYRTPKNKIGFGKMFKKNIACEIVPKYFLHVFIF